MEISGCRVATGRGNPISRIQRSHLEGPRPRYPSKDKADRDSARLRGFGFWGHRASLIEGLVFADKALGFRASGFQGLFGV